MRVEPQSGARMAQSGGATRPSGHAELLRKPLRLRNIASRAEAFDSLHFRVNEVPNLAYSLVLVFSRKYGKLTGRVMKERDSGLLRPQLDGITIQWCVTPVFTFR